MEYAKIRQSNFELLRIIAMLMIIILHYYGLGGVEASTQLFEPNFLIAKFMRIFSICAVNCYVMISGYFLVCNDFKVRKLARLWVQVAFYSFGIYLVMVLTGAHPPTPKQTVFSLFPVFFRQYWFVSCYFALYVLSPFLNTAIKAFDRQGLGKLLLALFGILVVWDSIGGYSDSLYISSGYSLTHFVFLYVLAAYIRLYWSLKINKYLYLLGYVLLSLLTFAATILMCRFGLGDNIWRLITYDFIGVVLQSFCLFMFFRGIKLRSGIINKIGGLTFAVYLIHEHNLIRPLLYKNILKVQDYYHSLYIIPHSAVCVLSVFAVCAAIEALRRLLFAKTYALCKNLPVIKKAIGA